MRVKSLERLQRNIKWVEEPNGKAHHKTVDGAADRAQALATKLGIGRVHPVGASMFCTICRVTPVMALEWLAERNEGNRNEIAGNIAMMARDIKAGLWRLTHQGMAFDLSGRLRDGQNRLAAIVEAECAAPMMISLYDVDAGLAVIDTGVKRRWTDQVLMLSGERVESKVSVVARWFTDAPQRKCSFQELNEVYREYRRPITWTVSQMPPRAQYVTKGPVLGAIARASFHVPQEVLETFCRVLHTGSGSESRPHDSNPLLLRGWLFTQNASGGGSAQFGQYAKTQLAIRKYADGVICKKVTGSDEDLFPRAPGASWNYRD